MDLSTLQFTTGYSDVASASRSPGRKQLDVPVGHAISLLLPTRRFGIPVYAAFASPALREPGMPVSQGPPDRWWLLEAQRGSLVLFTLCSIYPFTYTRYETVEVVPPKGSVAELRQELEEVRRQIDEIAPVFFRGDSGDDQARKKLLTLLRARIPESLWKQHEAMAADFFDWLGR